MGDDVNAFEKVIGPAFTQLDPLIQKAHQGNIQLIGFVTVERGNRLARLLCDIMKMPAAGKQVPFEVSGEHYDDRMVWNRRFDQKQLFSCFRLEGSDFIERMGPIKLRLGIVNENGAVVYRVNKAQLWGIPLPGFLSPRLNARESERNGKYVFQVRVSLPVLGRLVAYYGELQLETR
jgi:hypothetical protein